MGSRKFYFLLMLLFAGFALVWFYIGLYEKGWNALLWSVVMSALYEIKNLEKIIDLQQESLDIITTILHPDDLK